MIETEFNDKTGVLESKYIGEVTLSEVINYINSTKENKTYPRFLKIKTDATNANFIFSAIDLETIITANNNSINKYDFIIDAIIVDAPRTTAISMLYQEMAKNNNYKFNVFSTDEAASAWLDNY